jgi:zinc protease
MENSIRKEQFDNGLVVILKEIHTSPIISHWVWYRVGSRDEVTGKTGISHWVEHMQFKGTPRFPGHMLDRAISREGGMWNAFTYLDWTTYFETMPAAKIDLALQLEADRMQGSLFKTEEVESERTVIISERQGHENDPLFKLREEIQAAAFRVHPYHHEVIGDMSDLKSMSREDLFNHYRSYYVPNNAIMTVTGDFETGEMLQRIHELYGEIPPGNDPPRVRRVEPEQPGERRVFVEGPGETTYIQAAYHSPPASHPDFFPFTALDSLLTGPSGLNMFGGGISNKTSRMYRALVERDLAVNVYGGLQATVDPYVYPVTLTLHPSSKVEDAVGAMELEVKRIQETPPTAEELERALKQARALFAYGSESITNQAFWLGFAEMFATYEWFYKYLERLEAVTPEDVQRTAQTYLIPKNRVLGVYIPENGGNKS